MQSRETPRGRLPQFPGAVGITTLDAYSWSTPEGEPGGSPHMHLACAECYVVIGGLGRLQTFTGTGVTDVPLATGDVVWFQPGTIHRTINDDGALRVLVVMQNGGLPEAGDAVLTFPRPYLVDPDRYAQAASIVGEDGHASEERARARRDLALEGYRELRRRWDDGERAALAEFYSLGAALVRPKLAAWRERVQHGAAVEADSTLSAIDALASGRIDHLKHARVDRIANPTELGFGMCGKLAAYDPIRSAGSHRSDGDGSAGDGEFGDGDGELSDRTLGDR